MPRGLDDEVTRTVAERATGGALRLQDLTGVGSKTIRKLRSKGFRNIEDVKTASPQELQRVPGIGASRAQQMIREAGGDARDNMRSSSGSVSAAGIRTPIGDFKVEIGDKDKADAKNEGRGITRSPEAVAADAGKRAPITTDLDEWKANKGELDFPGVDTPTDEPEVMEQDRRFISPDDLIPDAEDDFF